MGPLRKPDDAMPLSYSYGVGGAGQPGSVETFRHNADVTAEAVAELQERATTFLDEDEWTLVEGYGACD